jgi:hypothetical protein
MRELYVSSRFAAGGYGLISGSISGSGSSFERRRFERRRFKPPSAAGPPANRESISNQHAPRRADF